MKTVILKKSWLTCPQLPTFQIILLMIYWIGVSHSGIAGENNPEPINWKQGFKIGILSGALTGVLLNPVDQFKIRSQALGSDTKEGFRAVLKAPFRGVRVSLIHGVSSNLLIFGSLPGFTALSHKYLTEDETQAKSLGGAMAGMFRSYVNAPVGTLRTRQYTEAGKKSLLEIFYDMPYGQRSRALFRGGPACALENAAIWGGYFAITESAKYRSEENLVIMNMGIGGHAFLIANALGYPFDTLSGVQRKSDHPKNMYETSKEIFAQRGLRGFYKGFISGVALRSFLSGMIISGFLTLNDHYRDVH